MKISLADRIISFNQHLQYSGDLPHGFQVLNPYWDNPETMVVMQKFYQRFYGDNTPRKFIIGINPSRHGAGVTGVPFTDTKRLESKCGITMHTAKTHEVSSVFMYDMIAVYGGVDLFYQQFYINSPFPLAIVKQSKTGGFLNANYYDSQQLFTMAEDFMIRSLQNHIDLGLITDRVVVLGKRNAKYIHKLNQKANLFGEIQVLDHPRYIQQYKYKERDRYIDQYLQILSGL